MALTREQSKAMAQDIVNNLEKYRVDAQEKTERSIKKMLANMQASKDAREAISEAREHDIAQAMGYGSNGTRTGD